MLVLVLAAGFGQCGEVASDGGEGLERHEFQQPHMGTVFRIVLYASDSGLAARAADAAFRRVAELNANLSDYDAGSEVRRLCEAAVEQPVSVSDDLWMVRYTFPTPLAVRFIL